MTDIKVSSWRATLAFALAAAVIGDAVATPLSYQNADRKYRPETGFSMGQFGRKPFIFVLEYNQTVLFVGRYTGYTY